MKTKLQKYDKYKPSGLDWLGDIPDEWNYERFGDKFIQNKTKNFELLEKNLLSLSYGRIIRKDINTSLGLLPESFETYQIVKSGFIILRLTDLQNDKKSLRVGLVKEKGIITSAYVGIELKMMLNPKFIFYLLYTYDIIGLFYWEGGSLRQSMRYEDIKRLPLLYPSIQTQITIANYLDTQTTKIDQEIELLTAKEAKYKQLKQTLISDTVTKGLDKSAKLKPSGVEWIGDIPQGWEVRRLKDFIIFSIAGEVIDVSYWGEGDELMYSAGKYPVKCNFEGFPSRKRTKQNDILIARNGDGFIHAPEVGAIYTNVVQMARLSAKVNKYFILYAMDTIKFNINQTSNGDFIASLNKTLWFNSDLPLPPLQFQQQIADYLDEQAGKIDQIIGAINTKITKLREFRKVLINDVVTGQVRIES